MAITDGLSQENSGTSNDCASVYYPTLVEDAQRPAFFMAALWRPLP